jgi:hypothetical protein
MEINLGIGLSVPSTFIVHSVAYTLIDKILFLAKNLLGTVFAGPCSRRRLCAGAGSGYFGTDVERETNYIHACLMEDLFLVNQKHPG